jgi:hypothetical protein
MSIANQIPLVGTSPSNDNFTAIFQAASSEYKMITGKSLDTHPFAKQLDNCESPQAFSSVFRTQAQSFSKSRKSNDRLVELLDPIVNILFTFSATLGEGIGLVRHLIRFISSVCDTWISAIFTRENHIQRGRCPSLSKHLPPSLLSHILILRPPGSKGCCC